MKKFYFILILLSVVLFSCKPEPDPESDSTAEVIKNAVTDFDGNKYDAVKIGNQIWMASNLKTTHYANGDSIPNPYAHPGEIFTAEDYFVYPEGDMNNVEVYGYLYSYPAAIKACPAGWHLPNQVEWYAMEQSVINTPKYLERSITVAKALASESHWNAVSSYGTPGFQLSTNNSTGFSAVPADFYGGYFASLGTLAAFWSSDTVGDAGKAAGKFLSVDGTGLVSNMYDRSYGLSVRCVKN